MLGCPDVDMDQLIASLVGIDAGETFAFQAEDLATLGAWWYFDLGFAIYGRDFCLQAEDGICKGDV